MAMAERKLQVFDHDYTVIIDPGYGINAIVIADVSDMQEADWLALRKNYIGASEVSAILGLNKYRSSFGVYADKVLDVSDDISGNVHIVFGNWMEPHIRAEFPKRFLKEEGIEIEAIAYPYMLQHPEHGFLSVNLDGLVIHPEHGVGVIEIKTAGEFQAKEWLDDELPEQYYAQIQEELSITGLDYAYVVALVGKRLIWKFIPRNNDFIFAMTGLLVDFWNNHIVAKEPPLPSGLENDTTTLKALYGSEASGTVVEMHNYQSDYDRYKELDKELKALEQEKEAIKQKFMQTMGEAEIGFIGSKKVTWKTTFRKGYEVKPTSFRSMRVY